MSVALVTGWPSNVLRIVIPLIGAATLSVGGSRTEAAALPISPGSWTLAVLPDTQFYALHEPQTFFAQTQWIADHAETHNIKYVLHVGDITNDNTVVEWERALTAMNMLNGRVPYAMTGGNHDYGPNGHTGSRVSLFNQSEYFGPGSFYATQATVGGFFGSANTDNSYHTFSAGGTDWLVLALEFGPRDEVVDWANQVVAAHPDHSTMLVTHAYMYFDETRYDWATKGGSQFWSPYSYHIATLPGSTINDGQDLWDKLVSQHPNFRLVFSGHVLGDGTGFLSSIGEDGNVVHQMLANYQFKAGGMGDMRLLEFKADGRTVVVRTYSPLLDRYDTSYDQQFTIDLNALRAPLEPPVVRHAVGANLSVFGATEPAENSVGAVVVAQSGAPSVSTIQLNRGDYQIAVGGVPARFENGIMLATVTQNVRDGIRASVEVGRNSFNDGVLTLSLTRAGVAVPTEVNINTAVAWFDFDGRWQGAHINADGTVPSASARGISEQMLSKQSAGRYHLNLGVDSRSSGLLFAIGNNNSNTLVQTGVSPDGSGWDIRVHHSGADHSAIGLNRDFSVLYLPLDTQRLVGGLYDGRSEISLISAGEFSMTRMSEGQYELSIPDETPLTGMLILTVAGLTNPSGVFAPDDNLLTYEASSNGSFLINSFDLPGVTLEDTMFAWAFISFESPITPAISPGDYDLDGDVDMNDYSVWKAQFGLIGDLQSDGNRDGRVDAADYTIWRDHWSTAGPAVASSISVNVGPAVPEPGTTGLAACVLLIFGIVSGSSDVCRIRRLRHGVSGSAGPLT